MILRAFYDFQYISLVLARTNMAEKPKKKLVPKSRSIEEDKNNWINNTVWLEVSGVIHSRHIGELSRQTWIRNNSFLKNRKKPTRVLSTRTVIVQVRSEYVVGYPLSHRP